MAMISTTSSKVSRIKTVHVPRDCLENDSTIAQSKSAIEKLPPDTLMEIMGLLNPKDIIGMRLTCKTLSAISRERSVWLNNLRLVCVEFGIFRPTFPESDMTISQLEHAATSPARFASHLRCNLSTGTVQPIYTRILSIRTKDTALDSYFLVPGGRYLVTSLRSGRIQLWDLGFSSNMAIPPNPIAFIDTEHFINIRCLGPTGDGLGIRIVTLNDHANPSFYQFKSLEIYPLSSTPDFIRGNCLGISILDFGALAAAYLADELLLLHINSLVIVWNLVQDTWAKFDIGEREDAKPIFVGDGNMITLEENYIDIFQIPHLHPRHADVEEGTERPLVTLNHTGHSHCTTLICNDCSWHTPNSMGINSRHFDIIGSKDTETCTIGHYTVVPLGNSKQYRLPKWLPLLQESTHLPSTSWFESRAYTSAWTAPNELLFFWEQDAALMASVLKMRTTSGLPTETVVGSMWSFREGSENNYAVCPFAGRVVTYSDAGYFEIRVMDYLA